VDLWNILILDSLNYSEGGSHNRNGDDDSKPQQSNSLLDISEGIAAKGEGKGIKARKGAKHSSVVPRKEALPCVNCSSFQPEEESANPFENTSAAIQNVSSTVLPDSKPIIVHKPKVTVAPVDSNQLEEMLKRERNVVIPVAALVCAPVAVLLALFIYKRCGDSRGNSDYTRMAFLIEDIYND